MSRAIHDASKFASDLTLDTDAVVVGTGAGGGTAAEILARAGLRVVLLEEGAHRAAADFTLREADAFSELYYDGANRTTKDGAIAILQGRTVGGSTTVNWTATFRTPDEVLHHWASAHGVRGLDPAELAPWFERMERRLNVAPWKLAPNENNEVLARGCAKLGYLHEVIPRNVDQCRNLGACGLGCPVNAKRSMLVTTVPGALDAGATLITRCRAERVILRRGKASGVEAVALDARGVYPTGRKVTVNARVVVAAGGGINTPGLLLRSNVPDPHGRLGKRTFIHPVLVSVADMPGAVDGWQGAPQSVYSDQFLWRDGIAGRVGYKVEAAPVYPMLFMSLAGRMGKGHLEHAATRYRNSQVLVALLRDGFHVESPGGSVMLRDDGSPVLDYAMNRYLWEGAYGAWASMAEIQFAAGAREVLPLHSDAHPYTSLAQARSAIDSLPSNAMGAAIFSAHVMGGCAMGGEASSSVVDSDGRHYQVENLYVIDGSVFPTSLGVNPQMSIYGLAARNATRLALLLGGNARN
ncbi:MAG: GMC family oxidoreductase [Betaproteobacteria bacterium]|nr:GMC family oxidoreductase [Betaproteobacteria bacterium]